jgi:hypothetical protein
LIQRRHWLERHKTPRVLFLCLYQLNEGVLAEGADYFASVLFNSAFSLASVTPIDLHYIVAKYTS